MTYLGNNCKMLMCECSMKNVLKSLIFILGLVISSGAFALETTVVLPVDGQKVIFCRYLTTKASGLYYAPQSVKKTPEGYYEMLSLVEYNRPNDKGVQRVVVEQYLAEEYYLVSRMVGFSASNTVVYDNFVESLRWNYISPQDIASVLLYLAKENLHEI